MYAEQLAPFLDSYLLRDHRGGGLDALAATVRNIIRNIIRRKEDDARGDASRMHEGYVLEALAKFGGHAESSEDGRLVYVFPALQVSTLDNHEGAAAGAGPGNREADQSDASPADTPAHL